MLKHNTSSYVYVDHLRRKPVNILITNACNLKCGGCTQHCDLFHKKEKWFIPLEQLEGNIKALRDDSRTNRRRGEIGIFGGEPTIHPKWKDILEILDANRGPFVLFTNGITNKYKNLPKNTIARVDYKDKKCDRTFCASMYAAKDANPKEKSYWDLARKRCYMWCGLDFFSIVYDNRAYLCEPAAALDRLILGKKKWEESSGWKIESGKDPFLQSDEAIIEQAERFCFRCGCCTNRSQNRRSKTRISKTNYDIVYPKMRFL